MKNILYSTIRLFFLLLVVLTQLSIFSNINTDLIYSIGLLSINIIIFLYKINHRFLLKSSFTYLFISIFSIITNLNDLTEKLYIWILLFLISWLFFEIILKSTYKTKNKTIFLKIKTDFKNLLKFIVKNILIIQNIVFSLSIIYLLYSFVERYLYFSSYFIEQKFANYFAYTGKLDILLLLIILFIFLRKDKKVKNLTPLIIFLIFVLKFIFSFTTKDLNENPNILQISPSSGQMWTQVHLKGHNFGNAHYDNSGVYLEGKEHRVLKWSNEEIVFVIDPILSQSGEIWIRRSNGKISNKVEFKYIKL